MSPEQIARIRAQVSRHSAIFPTFAQAVIDVATIPDTSGVKQDVWRQFALAVDKYLRLVSIVPTAVFVQPHYNDKSPLNEQKPNPPEGSTT